MAEFLKLDTPKRPRVRRKIRDIVCEADYVIHEHGCDSIVVIMTKKDSVELFSYGKGVLHRAGMCDYAKHIFMNSMGD